MAQTYTSTADILQAQASAYARLHPYIFAVVLLGIIGMGGVYLYLTNSVATMGFELQSLKQQNMLLKLDEEKLDIAIATNQSLFAMKSSPSVQQMPDADDKVFVVVRDGTAKKYQAPGAPEPIMGIVTPMQ